MKTSLLREELRMGSPLQLLLLNYTRAFLALISQSIACSQHHIIDRRLARWLLMMHDYAQANELHLTHELIAAMIGTRRAGVSVAANALRDHGKYDGHTPLIVLAEKFPESFEGTNKNVSGNDWICYYDGSDQLGVLLERLTNKDSAQ